MTSVRFHPAADEELLEATEWYIERSPKAAAGFIREIEHALSRIAEAPERYPLTRLAGGDLCCSIIRTMCGVSDRAW